MHRFVVSHIPYDSEVEAEVRVKFAQISLYFYANFTQTSPPALNHKGHIMGNYETVHKDLFSELLLR